MVNKPLTRPYKLGGGGSFGGGTLDSHDFSENRPIESMAHTIHGTGIFTYTNG